MKAEVSRVEMNLKHSTLTLGYSRKIIKNESIYFSLSYFSNRDNITLKLE